MHYTTFILWIHLVCMVGSIGALLAAQCCLPPENRNQAAPSRGIGRLVNILLTVGLLAGLSYYLLLDGFSRGPHYNGVVGVKFVFLLAATALVGMSKKTDRGDVFRWIALGLLLAASLFGKTII